MGQSYGDDSWAAGKIH